MVSRREAAKRYLKSLPPPLEKDLFGTSGVLLSNEIKYYATSYQMIYPFDEERLKPASYELTVGNNYSIGGKRDVLLDEPGKDTIRIPPFEVVIIETAEKINLPRFIIARWNIRVRFAYEGLLWVGGPQVDPGWVGNLPCPLYNLSDKEVTLHLGEPVAIMDFVKTTPFYPPKASNGTKCPVYECLEYDRPPKRIIFDDYETGLTSALYTNAQKKINSVEKKMHRVDEQLSKFSTRLDQFIGIIFAVLGIFVAALAIFVTSGPSGYVNGVSTADSPISPIWTYLFSVFSLGALVISTWSYFKTISVKKQIDEWVRTNKTKVIVSSRPKIQLAISREFGISIISTMIFILISGLIATGIISPSIEDSRAYFSLILLIPPILIGLIFISFKDSMDYAVDKRIVRFISYISGKIFLDPKSSTDQVINGRIVKVISAIQLITFTLSLVSIVWAQL